MKLRRFALLIQASRADQLSKRVSPDFIQAVKKLNPQDVRKLLKGFVPLDFISLLQKENPEIFEEALRGTVAAQLSSEQHKKWIEELGIDKQDAISEVYIAMLNDDPKRRGILSEVLLDGSYSDAFQYARKDQPALRLQLKQSLAPLGGDNGIVVPFCPIDKKLGIEKPLWNAIVENGKIRFEQGTDPSNRCTTKEILGKMSPEEFEKLKQTREGLSPEQVKLLEENKRTLEYDSGDAILRCSFHAQLPKFQSFLGAKTRQALKAVLDPERRKMGRNIPPAKYKRRQELEAKKQSGTLTPQERGELYNIQEYFKKKQVDYVYNPTSLDKPSAGEDGEGRSRHESITVEDTDDISREDASNAKFELERKLGEREFSVLSQVAEKVPLGNLVNKLQIVMSLSSKDPKRQSIEKDVALEALRSSQKFFGADQPETNKCNTCGEELTKEATNCSQANNMRKALITSYMQSGEMAEFERLMQQLDPKALQHYVRSGLPSKINNIYTGIEINEDDLGDLDLSGFESYKEEQISKASKLSEKEFRETIEKSLTGEQKVAYLGTDISSVEVGEVDVEKVNQLATYLRKTIQDVFTQELEDEFAIYLMGYGAH